MRILFSTLLCLLCFGCSSPSKKNLKPTVLVTLPPYAGFVEALVGDRASVEIFVPPGANPHIYEPSPEQIKHFTTAQVWFQTGDPIEQKIVPFLQQYSVEIINLSAEDDATTDHAHDEHDLHLWMDPRIAARQIEEMAAVLSRNFPDIAPLIKKNSQKLMQELQDLDQKTATQLKPLRGHYLLISHPALGYFCERYGLHQLSVEVEGKDPLPQDIASLMDQLKTNPVPVVFIEPQYNNKGALLIARQLHLPVETINPYDQNYFDMMQQLTNSLLKYYGHSD